MGHVWVDLGAMNSIYHKWQCSNCGWSVPSIQTPNKTPDLAFRRKHIDEREYIQLTCDEVLVLKIHES